MPHILSLPVCYMNILVWNKSVSFFRVEWKKMRVTFSAEDGNYTGENDDGTGDDNDSALTCWWASGPGLEKLF